MRERGSRRIQAESTLFPRLKPAGLRALAGARAPAAEAFPVERELRVEREFLAASGPQAALQ
jgi:hypothetical protein